MNDDLHELLKYLKSHGVEFMVIGAHAVSFYAHPRMTADIDLWIGRDRENAERLRRALDDFGASIGEEGAKKFAELDRQMVRLGVPPHMIDLLNFADGATFPDAYERRVIGEIEGVEVPFPSREDLIEIKRTVGRAKDLADIEGLEGREN